MCQLQTPWRFTGRVPAPLPQVCILYPAMVRSTGMNRSSRMFRDSNSSKAILFDLERTYFFVLGTKTENLTKKEKPPEGGNSHAVISSFFSETIIHNEPDGYNSIQNTEDQYGC